MTVYALRLENAKDTAGRVRMGDLLGLTPNGNLGARGGIRPGPTAADVAVTAGTMNVTVQPFLAWVDGGVGDTQGGYPFVSDAVVTLTLANGHGSLSRTDVVCAVVRDNPYDSSGTVAASVEVVQGTPGAGSPTLPTNCVPLRNVVVPAGASTGTGGLSSGALSTDRRTYTSGLGGVITVASQAERDALPAIKGTVVYRADIDKLQWRGAGGWNEHDLATDAAVSYAPNTADAFGGSRAYRRAGMGVLRLTFTVATDRVPGNLLLVSPYPSATLLEGDVANLGTGTRHLVSISATGEVVAQSAMTAGHSFSGSLVYPL